MSSIAGVSNRGEKCDDNGCAKKWEWESLSVEVEGKVGEEVKKEHISTWFQKVGVVQIKCSK